MMDRDNTEQVLRQFAKTVIKDAKKNLKNKGKIASKDLYNSMKFNLKVTDNSLDLDILMEDYGKFVDQGVSGTEKRYNTPYRFRNKKPPVRFLQTWLKQKSGVFRARDRRSRAFAIQNTIFRFGLKPTKFFEDSFERAYRSLPDDVVEAYGLDLEEFIKFTLDANV